MVSEKETYSFSKLNLFCTCPYAYKLRYINKVNGKTNAFAQYGTEVHSIMERYSKGVLTLFELVNTYDDEYKSAITEPFPEFFMDLATLYYNQGKEFLEQFQGYSEYEIMGVEQNFDIDLGEFIFTGIIDLVLKDKDNNLIILDYKSKSGFKSKKEQAEYARQLYLYSLYVKKKYGSYPSKLIFMMFRKQKRIEIDFNEKSLQEAIDWCKTVVKKINAATTLGDFGFPPVCEAFYCNNLCDGREHCDNREEENNK
ncbi:MAG: PD-(D/E)XK nuclease family protein [Alphaproteobacteria bacterium]|nr:PD-(D/E)XK nuclease family protein [Alphaproteobacteria bacterium]